MRSFQRRTTLDPVPGIVVRTLRKVDRAAGAESQYRDQLPQLLASLRDQARVESITASSAIEGVLVEEGRARRLVSGSTERLRNRSEAEFAGYTAALDYLHREEPGQLSVGLILHLHRLLFSFTDGQGGLFKTEDNLVIDRQEDRIRQVRFRPISWQETPFFTGELVARTEKVFETEEHHPLIASAAFVLDLLCIHPFVDGNGRVARLATTYLLERAGYSVGRYVSLEQLVYETKDEYYDSLDRSTQGWFDGQHDAWPWVAYLINRVHESYRRFDERVAAATSGGTKQNRVRNHVLLHAPPTFTIAQIRQAVPGVSDNTIRLVLSELKHQGCITSDGTGRGATWRRSDTR